MSSLSLSLFVPLIQSAQRLVYSQVFPVGPPPLPTALQNSGYQCEMNLGENKQKSRTTNTVNCLRVFLAGGLLTAGHTG